MAVSSLPVGILWTSLMKPILIHLHAAIVQETFFSRIFSWE